MRGKIKPSLSNSPAGVGAAAQAGYSELKYFISLSLSFLTWLEDEKKQFMLSVWHTMGAPSMLVYFSWFF